MLRLRRQVHAGSGKILCLRATRSTGRPSRTPTPELPLATTEPLSGQPMVVTAGSFNRVEPQIRCTGFRLLTPPRERQLARMGQSSEQRTEEIRGPARQVERLTISMRFHLLMQITERL